MKFENYISFRYLISGSGNKEVSRATISVIIVTAIAISIYISSIGVMNGYIYGLLEINREVKSSHIVYNDFYNNFSEFNESDIQRLMDIDGIRSIYTYKEVKGLITANSINIGIPMFRAIDESAFINDTGLDRTVKILSGTKDLSNGKIMISRKTSSDLRIDVGDVVFFVGMLSEAGAEVTFKRFTVSGIFTTGYVELDEALIFTGISSMNTILQNIPLNIAIKVDNPDKVNDIAENIRNAGFYFVSTWKEINSSDITANSFNRNIIGFIVTLVVIMAVVNIITTVFMAVNEKKREIGILKTMGYSSSKILVTYLLKGIYIGLISGLAGVILGLAVSFNLDSIIDFFSFIINGFNYFSYNISRLFDKRVYEPAVIDIFSKDFYLDKIYSVVSFSEIVFILLITTFFSIISSVAPAMSAGAVKPNEVIRNG